MDAVTGRWSRGLRRDNSFIFTFGEWAAGWVNQATAFDKNDYSPLHTIFMQDDLRMNRLTLNFGAAL